MKLDLRPTTELTHFYSRCLPDNITAEFMSKLPAAFATALTSGTESGVSTSPPHIDLLTDCVTSVLRSTLDTIAPLKNKKEIKKPNQTSDQTTIQTTPKLERKWYSTKLEVFHLAWKDSLVSYKRALSDAKSAYYSSIENNYIYIYI